MKHGNGKRLGFRTLWEKKLLTSVKLKAGKE
jgi:hypothetical protein